MEIKFGIIQKSLKEQIENQGVQIPINKEDDLAILESLNQSINDLIYNDIICAESHKQLYRNKLFVKVKNFISSISEDDVKILH